MPRSSAYEVVLDAGQFTPNQLQTVAVGRLGFQAGTRWLRDHVISHRTLVSQDRVGLVLWAWQLEYAEPLRFEDADEALIDVRGRIRGPHASQLEIEMTLSGPRGVAVRTRAASVPLQLSGDEALSGIPSPLPDRIVERFREDERERSPFRSQVRALRSTLERDGERLASSTISTRVHRHHCEVADQWYWAESLGFAGAAREELVLRYGSRIPQLRRAMAEGMRRVDVVWLRAGQLWDTLDVQTTAYQLDDEIAFVSELRLPDDGGTPFACVVERT